MTVKSGTTGNDVFVGGTGRDYFSGLEGYDLLSGGAGADALYGGDGDDTLQPIDAVSLIADGADRLDGGEGFDIVDYSNARLNDADADGKQDAITTIDLELGGLTGLATGDRYFSIEGVIGTVGKDSILGDEDRNVFVAGSSAAGDIYDGRGGLDEYISVQSSNVPYFNVTMELAYGARAQTLAGTTKLAAGEAVAYYVEYSDANNNGKLDNGERSTRYFDRLSNVEEVQGSIGNDSLGGTAGADIYTGSGGRDRINGGAGFDFVIYGKEPAHNVDFVPVFAIDVDLGLQTVTKTVPYGTGYDTDTLIGIEGIIGTSGSDQIVGDKNGNAFYGLSGSDALDGDLGADTLVGGAGDDILVGGAGDDVIAGGIGADVVDGGDGRDLVSYADAVTSIAVNLLANRGETPVIDGVHIYNTESARDRLISIEDVDGSSFDDVLKGSNVGNFIEGLDGSDLILGNGGNDTLWGEQDPAHILTNLIVPTAFVDDLPEPDDGASGNVIPTFGDDIDGGDGNDLIYGGLGADHLAGGRDNDWIDGGAGSDIVDGGAGDDTLSGGAGFDFIFGGAGSDTVTYEASGAAVQVNLSAFWENSGGDASSNLIVEILDDLANGGDATSLLSSSIFLSLTTGLGSDDDTDLFSLGVPDVTLGLENARGSLFADTLTGNELRNTLQGLDGADILAGLDGDDILIGGAGPDTLTGGLGADYFQFAAVDLGKTPATTDHITDFSSSDLDVIDVSAIDALAGGADNAFKFIGTSAFDGNKGELRYALSNGDTQLLGDIDGDKKADFVIVLSGSHDLLPSDLVL